MTETTHQLPPIPEGGLEMPPTLVAWVVGVGNFLFALVMLGGALVALGAGLQDGFATMQSNDRMSSILFMTCAPPVALLLTVCWLPLIANRFRLYPKGFERTHWGRKSFYPWDDIAMLERTAGRGVIVRLRSGKWMLSPEGRKHFHLMLATAYANNVTLEGI